MTLGQNVFRRIHLFEIIFPHRSHGSKKNSANAPSSTTLSAKGGNAVSD
jgi:hypothetical protein